MPDPRFPNVPQTAGVPPVLRSGAATPTPPKPLTNDNTAQSPVKGPQWGIFTSTGKAVLAVDNIAAFEIRNGYQISDYPIEGGTFESYNKVKIPYDLTVTVTKGGKDLDRLKFQNDLDALIGSIDFFTVITPDKTYFPINPIEYDFRRTSESGVTLLTAEIHCRQVRVSASIAFTNSKEPSGAATVNDGPVQTSAPPTDTGKPG